MKQISIDTTAYSKDIKKDIVSKLAYLVSDIDVSDKDIKLFAKEEEQEKLKKEIKTIIEDTCNVYNRIEQEVLFENKGDLFEIKEDTFTRLIESGQVIEFDTGLLGFGETFLMIMNLIDTIIVKWGRQYNSKEYCYPDLISIDTLKQYNYLEEFPQYLMFSSHIKNDIKLIQYFGKNADRIESYSDKYIARPELVNKLAVCPHVYKQFQGKTLDITKPIVVSTVGKCKRYEAANMNKCERLLDFTMREIVILGKSSDVLRIREEFIGKVKELIQYLTIDASIKSASDPFFSKKFNPKILLQRKLKLKYELNVYLPYNESELSAGSFNYHYDHFAQCFDLKGEQEVLTTGCMAFGLERFAYALISQYGVDHMEKLVERLLEYPVDG